MSFCRGCGHQIHESAVSCPQCGAVQQVTAVLPPAAPTDGTLWLPVPGLVLGIMAVLALFDLKPWKHDQALGVGMFAVAALVLGGVGLARQSRGRGMSIAALVLGVIGLLGAIGSQL